MLSPLAAEGAKTTPTTQSKSQTTLSHEYIRDTLPFRYRECKSCGTRTVDNKYHKTYSSPLIPNRKNELTDKEKQKEEKEEEEEPQEQKQQQLIKNVFGQVSEPICTYYRCHHKFSLHGSSRCRCRHPTNKTLGIFVRYL
jgi:hypothetical protein